MKIVYALLLEAPAKIISFIQIQGQIKWAFA